MNNIREIRSMYGYLDTTYLSDAYIIQNSTTDTKIDTRRYYYTL
jgi:hypothetical protein